MRLHTPPARTVAIGSTVRIRDLGTKERETFTLARPNEADIRRNRISSLTPLGRALFDRQPGEIVEVYAPGGVFHVEIEAVENGPELQ